MWTVRMWYVRPFWLLNLCGHPGQRHGSIEFDCVSRAQKWTQNVGLRRIFLIKHFIIWEARGITTGRVLRQHASESASESEVQLTSAGAQLRVGVQRPARLN